ncbi:hypothetical protein NWFMUON74_37790 [Nocardia wallacei]|uniref:Uncharacterized protein n=1 Tax=Nocardia wallacei TaxID=480035 RepID=A0A7G1KL64_9NOCA|nr:hypothetical protein NWFMUON74_37790 [Nocardia wallacei]
MSMAHRPISIETYCAAAASAGDKARTRQSCAERTRRCRDARRFALRQKTFRRENQGSVAVPGALPEHAIEEMVDKFERGFRHAAARTALAAQGVRKRADGR